MLDDFFGSVVLGHVGAFIGGGALMWLATRQWYKSAISQLQTKLRSTETVLREIEESPAKHALKQAQSKLNKFCAVCGRDLNKIHTLQTSPQLNHLVGRGVAVYDVQYRSVGYTTIIEFKIRPMMVFSFAHALVYYVCGGNDTCRDKWNDGYTRNKWAAVNQKPEKMIAAINGDNIDLDPLSREIAALEGKTK